MKICITLVITFHVLRFAKCATKSVITKIYLEADLNNYKFRFATSDGQTREETGKLVKHGDKDKALYIEGSYSFKGPDGSLNTVLYTSGPEGHKSRVIMYKPRGPEIDPPLRPLPEPVAIPTAAVASLAGGGLG